MARLQNHRPSSSRRDAYSSDEDQDDLANEWDRENQEIMDDSMMFGDGLPKKQRRSGGKIGRPPKKQRTRKPPPKPARKPEPRKKAPRSPVETDELNDSIASHRPRRACATPSTPAPKKITWPKRDLDKLKHVIQLKKPTAAEADWAEVARLLAKDGVDSEIVKQAAISKLKWKEPVQEQEKKEEEEEEERKQRRGAAAKIKEGVRMHEEMRKGRRENETQMSAESMEDYQPEDVAADQSLLALGTPLVAKKKGGTRGSIMPKPVEDSPITRGRNSTFNSPRLDQTKVKEVETTLRYVQHLSNMQARPNSRANTSTVSKSGRGSKNTSMSLEQGARKAMKIINRGRTIDEEDEDEESNGEEEEDHSEDEAFDY
ncbi:hypothetical protein CAEBREN_14654 [Caenorhabditis brenneri]|uniref:Kinetochore null protein 2-like domain-containing protein n=1 Tax=Caenorhabditis brenneri TaxID=135651 RepID=G0NZ85_CAEBE|nr:hypothetical protein CAEBREN_14654 [Caenorhabditis brenneri]